MACEMCGNNTTSAVVRVEGVEMQVCNSCSRHGTMVRNIIAPTKKKGSAESTAKFSSQPRREEEIIEQVKPEVGKLLRKHREKLGLDQEKFASKLGIKLSTYHHYENGSAIPDIPTARKLESELKVGLVIRIKFEPGATKAKEDSRGMQLGDFLRKR